MIYLGSQWGGCLINRQATWFSYFPFDVHVKGLSATFSGGSYASAQLWVGGSLVGPKLELFTQRRWGRESCDIAIPTVTGANVDGAARCGALCGGNAWFINPVFEIEADDDEHKNTTVILKASPYLFSPQWTTRYGWDYLHYGPGGYASSGFRYVNEWAPPGATYGYDGPGTPAGWNSVYPDVPTTPLARSGTFYGLVAVADDPAGWPIEMDFGLRVDHASTALNIACTGSSRVVRNDTDTVHVSVGQMVNFVAGSPIIDSGWIGGHVMLCFRPDDVLDETVGWDEAPWDTRPWGP